MNTYFNNIDDFHNNTWNNLGTYDYNDTFKDIKFVYCPVCNGKALVKTNKKNKKMLRCDLCYVLLFANGDASQQQYLLNLPLYQEYY